MKFSIAILLFVVTLSAVGCAALINANGIWRQSMVTLTVACLAIATIAGFVNRSRSFAIGFAVAGWIYLVLVFVPGVGLRDDLLTDRAVGWLLPRIHGEQVSKQNVNNLVFTPNFGRVLAGGTNNTLRIWDASGGTRIHNDFAEIGHALWTLIVAFLGGVLASLLAARSNRGRDTSGHRM